MLKNHSDRQLYFLEQDTNTKKYIIPFLHEKMFISPETSILEVGCGEGGNLKAFIEMGCKVTGIDLTASKIKNANMFFEKEISEGKVHFILGDIYNYYNEFASGFDLVILKDTLEHIPEQEKLMGLLKGFLKPGGMIFLAFPPWQMPFGGHQQMCQNKYLGLTPWLHLLPNFLYKGILKFFKETEGRINELLEVKSTRITIERFERILKTHQLKKEKVSFYFINPNYEVKFGLKPRKTWNLINKIPYFRDFVITTCFYLVSETEK